MNMAYLLLGSNQGNSLNLLKKARRLIEKRVGAIVQTSAVYKTKAWGETQQPDFFNQVLGIETELSPRALLEGVLQIEKMLGRERTDGEKWKPRSIDIDILFYNDELIDQKGLKIPHPLLHLRRFTLVPMAEVAGEFVHPVFQKTIKDLLLKCKDPLYVERYEEK